MIKGIITSCSTTIENGVRRMGVPNATTRFDECKLDISLLLDNPLTNREMEELQHLLARRVRICQDDRSIRPPRRADHVKKLKFRG